MNLRREGRAQPGSFWQRVLSTIQPTGFRRKVKEPDFTLVHVTHVKAGSTWIEQILRKMFGPYATARGESAAAQQDGDLSKYVFEARRIYPAMFLTREEFMSHSELWGAKRFVVIRDLRDTMVSFYFSCKETHELHSGLKEIRADLQRLDKEEGLLYCMSWMRKVANLQLSWVGQNELIYRYCDLVRNDKVLIPRIFDLLGIEYNRSRLESIIADCSFESRFQRPLGVEASGSHGRQGAPGDWKRHFTPRVAQAFAEEFSDVLELTGCESDPKWVEKFVSGGRVAVEAPSGENGAVVLP